MMNYTKKNFRKVKEPLSIYKLKIVSKFKKESNNESLSDLGNYII